MIIDSHHGLSYHAKAMMTDYLDSIDKRILELLQRDGRVPSSAIALEVGLSQPSVHERMKKLSQRGVIKGYTALLEPEALGLNVLAFISVRYTTKTDAVAEAVARMPEVLEAHHIAGEDCLLLKVRCRAPRDLERVIERIWDSGPVASTNTTIVLSSYKETCALPLDACADERQEASA
jgi:Lrp/AsnC family leucine-responsive transcriptional regulator